VASRQASAEVVACVDFGSTFTKAALVDVGTGTLVATTEHRTTIDTDVLDGWHACRAQLVAADPRAMDAEVLACSSAGGGLRIAVVGNEELVTAEAGRRVALSSGGRVVHVAAGGLTPEALSSLSTTEPDVVLLVGGTDGGNSEVLLSCARTLAGAQWPGPVVAAGNAEAADEIHSVFTASGTPCVVADNVVPQIGVLRPESARAAIRETFLRHVIGGKHLSRSADFPAMVQGATPDVVLTAVELLAQGLDAEHPGVGDVVVVDVGGATTDVHSVVELDPEDAGLARDVVAAVPVSRTVEADLGMRWSAVSTVETALAGGVLTGDEAQHLLAGALQRHEDPSYLPRTPGDQRDDERVAAAAVSMALRRHAGRRHVVFGPDGRVVERSGRDLREVDLLVGSGGVLRHAARQAAKRVLSDASGVSGNGEWQLPRAPRVVVDREYVLAPAGLLAAKHPVAAYRLLSSLR
jgi:uncharacterized protein (TIGR01319 family)